MQEKYLSGTLPGAGTYRCLKCGFEVSIKDNEVLPVCPMCGFEEFEKIN